MSGLDDLLARETPVDVGALPAPPSLRCVVVTCMDCRIDLGDLLGLEPGEAHVLRNAGGVVTDDVLRSVTISQRKLGTTSVAVVTHTGCGMATFTDEELRTELGRDTGEVPTWAPGTFRDPGEAALAGAEVLRASPHLLRTDDVRAYVLDLDAGRLVPAGS